MMEWGRPAQVYNRTSITVIDAARWWRAVG